MAVLSATAVSPVPVAKTPRPSLPPWLWPRSAYMHIPFCAHHCGYCDFAVVTGQDDRIDDYLDALGTELSLLGGPHAVDTIYVGGGTPTYLNPGQLARLFAAIAVAFGSPRNEFSIEATPESLTTEKVAILSEFGVTRVSLGAQSFNRRSLDLLERRHGPAEVIRAMESLKIAGLDASLDLIFGVPGQTIDDWAGDLRRAMELRPDHLSCYGLTYEKGTPLWKQRQRGLVRAVDEETERAMFLLAHDNLTAAGFEHYEISNYARRGKQSRHNHTYWANHAYFGCGVGAARYVMGRRDLNTRSLPEYLNRINEGRPATMESETLVPLERARETLTLNLRRLEAGIDRGAFAEQTGFDLDDLASVRLNEFAAMGLLADDGRTVALTFVGMCVADTILTKLWNSPPRCTGGQPVRLFIR